MNKSRFSIGKYILAKAILEFRLKIKKRRKDRLYIFTNRNVFGILLNSINYFFRKNLKIFRLKDALIKFSQNDDLEMGYFGKVTDAFDVKTNMLGNHLWNIPQTGPIVFYANHPFSGMDAFAVASEIEKVRPDLKVLAASFLENFPGFKEKAFIIKVFNKKKYRVQNKQVYLDINKHIKEGKALLIFPSGLVSKWSRKNKVYALDPPWREGFVNFGEKSPATKFIPVFLQGEPSNSYLKWRLYANLLSNFFVIREFANQINKQMTFYLGEAINSKQITDLNIIDKVSYLRGKVYELGTRYFYTIKGHNQIIGLNYCSMLPLLTNFESQLLTIIDKKLGFPKLAILNVKVN